MSSRFARRVAIVTGGAAGIGAACAQRLAVDGATVVVVDVREPDPVFDGIFIRADVSHPAEIEGAVAAAVDRLGRIDIVVNNAGVTRRIDFFSITEADWNAIHHVNARGAFFVLQATARVMAEASPSGGSIVNIASIAGKGYRHTSNAAYAASKGALIALTRVAALELSQHQIRVNAVCPGITRTTMLGGLERDGSAVDAMVRAVPLGRANEPRDVANTVAFLASDEAAMITGQSWNVDGGLVFD